MANETIDYAAILADLEAKKTALETTIASLRSAMALGAAGQAGDAAAMSSSGIPSMHNGEVPIGAFLGKSIPEAAKLYLEIVKKKQTSKEISEGLKRGGIESSAKKFATIVHSVLDRSSKSGSGIIKLDRSHWGLAGWYPRGVSAAPVAAKKGKGKKGKKAKKSKHSGAADVNASAPQNTASTSSQATSAGPQEQILQLLRSKPGTEFPPTEIIKQLGLDARSGYLVLGRLTHRKLAEKTPAGNYRIIKPHVNGMAAAS